MNKKDAWFDLIPHIIRQRLIIEATTEEIVKPKAIRDYLHGLAEVTEMEVTKKPWTRSAHELGYYGGVLWRTSGAHVYTYPTTWQGKKGDALFTCDTYTCKPFSIDEAVAFTRNFLDPIKLVYHEVKIPKKK